jgi:hypothetical protein
MVTLIMNNLTILEIIIEIYKLNIELITRPSVYLPFMSITTLFFLYIVLINNHRNR